MTRKKWAVAIGLLSAVALGGAWIQRSSTTQARINASISAYAGSCPCPYSVDSAGRKCGARSAYAQRGPSAVQCYASDTEPDREEIFGMASVVDGDTLDIRGERIRLDGVDAPESRQLCQRDGKPWRCGQAAAMWLADRLQSVNVRCRINSFDRWGRKVGTCYVAESDINGELVRSGMAWAFVRYSRRYEAEEAEARADGRGIFAANVVTEAPWLWRRHNATR